MKRVLLTSLVSLVFTVQAYSQIVKQGLPTDKFFDKITGSWELQNQPVVEQWTLSSSGIYKGRLLNFKTGDSILTETIRVVKNNDGKVNYEATVLDQNDGKAIPFTLVKSRRKRVKFANTLHDYPQFIEYQLKDEDNLWVIISGQMRGKARTLTFKYKRAR